MDTISYSRLNNWWFTKEARKKITLNLALFQLLLLSLCNMHGFELVTAIPVDTIGKQNLIAGNNQNSPQSASAHSIPPNILPNDDTDRCPPGWFRGGPLSCACFKMFTKADHLVAKSLQSGTPLNTQKQTQFDPLLAQVVQLDWFNAMQSCQMLYPGSNLLGFDSTNEMDLVKNFFCPFPFIGQDSWIQQAVYAGPYEYSGIDFDRYRNERNGFCSLLYMTPYGDLANVTTPCDESHSFICKITLGFCIINQTFNNPLLFSAAPPPGVLRRGEILPAPPGLNYIPPSPQLFSPYLGKHGAKINVKILANSKPLVINVPLNNASQNVTNE